MLTRVILPGAAVLAVALGAGCRNGSEPNRSSKPVTEPASKSAIPVIGHGAEVNLKEHLVAGKTTVFDFHSEQCPACVMLAPELDKLAEKRADLAIVKVDVNRPDVTGEIDWDSPVARQHKLESLPHLVIFDADGKQVAAGEEALARVAQWIEG